MEVGDVFIVLFVLLVSGVAGGWIAKQLGQPIILGELTAGALLGLVFQNAIPLLAAHEVCCGECLHLLAQIGICALLFEVGLDIRLKKVISVGGTAVSVALVGIIVPFALGYWIAIMLFNLSTMVALFIGATLTATSVGITAEVLDELGMIKSDSSLIILSAAVLDDVIGLIIIVMVSGMASGQSLSVMNILHILGMVVVFFAIVLLVLRPLASRIMDLFEDTYGEKGVTIVSFMFLLVLAYIANVIGLDPIVGAFMAGLTLSEVRQRSDIDHALRPFISVFASLFFILMGLKMDLSLLNPFDPGNVPILGLSMVLIACAIVGKLVCGLVVPAGKGTRLIVGIGMLPRGEVGLICGDIGLVSGVLCQEHFSALLLVVMVTTFLGPILLRGIVPSHERPGA
ncbi:MAG: cation:proton antiporter [Thermodesulfobacteriota bacterium]|nr:cation:proton antiporter [Thermodesulfobacteriota bacterium]